MREINRKFLSELGKKSAKPVKQYDLQGNFIKEWESASEAARQLNIKQSNISACCLGKTKTAYGHIWTY